MPSVAPPATVSLAVEFGAGPEAQSRAGSTAALRLPVPLLAGESTEEIFAGLRPAGERDGFVLLEGEGWLAGWAREPLAADLAGQTQRLYCRLFSLVRDRHLYRIWNYIPRINACGAGLENYRAFCRGRSQAFEETFGPDFQRVLCAASAVGCEDGRLAMIFLAGDVAPRHVENPAQVPAYEYPPQHGPRPPSFARATLVGQAGRRLAFISGTAAIKGHETVAPHSIREQLACTLDNLRLISRAAGLDERLGADEGYSRRFKIFLRHGEDLPLVRGVLEHELLRPADRAIYLRADICRAALKIEIEATLVG